MKLTADVVVIGAGVIGCSTAYHLAARGIVDVVVVEMGQVGSCLLYTSPSPRDGLLSRMPSSA